VEVACDGVRSFMRAIYTWHMSLDDKELVEVGGFVFNVRGKVAEVKGFCLDFGKSVCSECDVGDGMSFYGR